MSWFKHFFRRFFCDWKAESANFFAFRMYDKNHIVSYLNTRAWSCLQLNKHDMWHGINEPLKNPWPKIVRLWRSLEDTATLCHMITVAFVSSARSSHSHSAPLEVCKATFKIFTHPTPQGQRCFKSQQHDHWSLINATQGNSRNARNSHNKTTNQTENVTMYSPNGQHCTLPISDYTLHYGEVKKRGQK